MLSPSGRRIFFHIHSWFHNLFLLLPSGFFPFSLQFITLSCSIPSASLSNSRFLLVLLLFLINLCLLLDFRTPLILRLVSHNPLKTRPLKNVRPQLDLEFTSRNSYRTTKVFLVSRL